MPLPFSVESLEAVEEAHHALYVEQETGGYRLDVDGYEDPVALKNTLTKVRPDARLGESFKKAFPGKSVAEITAMVQAAQAGSGKPAKKGGDEEDVERLVEKRVRDALAEVTPELEDGKKAKAELRTLRLDNARRKAALEAGVRADEIEDSLELSSKFFALDDEGTVIVVDEDGDPTGQSVADFYGKTWKKRKPRMYDASGSSGADVVQSRHATRSAAPGGQQLSSTDKISAGLRARGG